MIEAAVAFVAGVATVLVVSVLAYRYGVAQSQQYLEAARAVQAITNETTAKMIEYVEAEGVVAEKLEALRVTIVALEARQALLGKGIDRMGQDVSILNATGSRVEKLSGAPGATRIPRDSDFS